MILKDRAGEGCFWRARLNFGTPLQHAFAIVRRFRNRFRALFSDIAEPLYVARFIELDQRGYVPKDEVYRQLADELRLPDQADSLLFDDFYEHFHRHAVAYPGVTDVLETLRSHGIALGIITNGGVSHQQATINALQIGSFFSSILVSEAEGLRKPDERIFLRGLEQLGVSPSEAVFVGDHPEVDVEGARAAGLWSVWRRDEYWDECRSAHAKIEDLDALPTLLAQGPWVSPPSSAPDTAVKGTGSFS